MLPGKKSLKNIWNLNKKILSLQSQIKTTTTMKLEKRIHAKNETVRMTVEVLNDLLPKLKNLVGEKIYLVDGSRSKKFNIELLKPEPVGFNGEWVRLQNVYLEKSYRSLYLRLSVSFKDTEHSGFYEKTFVWVGDLGETGQVLTSIREDEYTPKTYDLETVQSNLRKRDELKKQLDTVKEQLGDFKEWW